jgi:hypothetical protein
MEIKAGLNELTKKRRTEWTRVEKGNCARRREMGESKDREA